MRRTPVLLLLLALALAVPATAPAAPLLVLRDGRLQRVDARGLGPADPVPGPAPARLRAARPKGPTVPAELDRVLAAATISAADHDRWSDDYATARRVVATLDGRRRAELQAVVTNLETLAAQGGFSNTTRLPLWFATLERNTQWWPSRPVLGYGARVSFDSSLVVWQSYPGQGLQVQWLGTFGRANGLITGGRRYDAKLRGLLAEVLPLASRRAGGLAFESTFAFDGGKPGWVSGLSQGTAVQAITRAAGQLADPVLLDTARSLLGVFRTPPPEGVRVATPAGAHYLQYSFRPGLLVLNGFVQSLNGLSDLATLGGDPDAAALFAQGEAELRTEIPAFDTGAWSRYSNERESDLGYHRLLVEFLQGLCARLTKAGTPDPALYCQTARDFVQDEQTPPQVAVAPIRGARPRARRALRIPYTLDKISTITTQVTRDAKVVAGRTVQLGRGRHELRFTPSVAGRYELSVTAVDLAGNRTTATATLDVAAPAKRPR